jgi:hypothetical protein
MEHVVLDFAEEIKMVIEEQIIKNYRNQQLLLGHFF